MSPAFRPGVERDMPGAGRIVDKLHMMQPFSKAIDEVRVAEAREYEEKRALPSRTKHVWPKNEEDLAERQRAKKESLAGSKLKAGRAHAMRQAMRDVCACATRDEAEAKLKALASWMMHSRLEPMKKVGRVLKEQHEQIPNYFDHRHANAIQEGMNSIIRAAKRTARGYRNPRYFKTVIYLDLGKMTFPVMEKCATH